MNIFSVFLCLLQLFSVNTAYAQETQQKKGIAISDELVRWNKGQKVQLQPHQLRPIEYLEKHVPSQKGLVLHHNLGTGKTLAAIGFAERNPTRQIIIIGPTFLEGHWTNELSKYGVPDIKRYRFFSYEKAPILLEEDLSNSIVIVDEAHRLVEKVRAVENLEGPYQKLYLHLWKAHKILSLTATPLYHDTFDIIYHINLVAGKEILPFNHKIYERSFYKYNTFNSIVRGYVGLDAAVGKYVSAGGPVFGFVYACLTGIAYKLPSQLLPFDLPPLRELDLTKLTPYLKQYFSHYARNDNLGLYPSTREHMPQIQYSSAQLNFLYKLYGSELSHDALKQLQKDFDSEDKSPQNNDSQGPTLVNGSGVQDRYKWSIGAGREVGNLIFGRQLKDGTKKALVPEKFERILNKINESEGPVVVYSHYFYNGILYFRDFLDSKGYKGQYRIFTPYASANEQTEIVQGFNEKKYKVLLLHPNITEGISLKGTRQLHFLEMPYNEAVKQQIVGRTVRYRSHEHLPPESRNVAVYCWGYYANVLKNIVLKRKNWYYNFEQYHHTYAPPSVDKELSLKNSTPDDKARVGLKEFGKTMVKLNSLLTTTSIETQ